MKRKLKEYLNHPASFIMFILVVLAAAVTMLVALFAVVYILVKGIPNITPELFEWEYNSKNVSMMPAIINTVLMIGFTLIVAVPIGVFSAVYLAEYSNKNSKFVKLIRTTVETLAGIPSIVFGLFGFLFFVINFKWEYSFLAGSLTLAIMILPLIMRTTEEAILAVPDSYREGSFGLGAGKLRTVFRIILPSAMPSILAGIILAIGRIVGESAALIYTAGTTAAVPKNLFSSTRTLAVHMYCLLSEGLYTNQAYASAVVLLVVVIFINALSSFAAKKLSGR